MPIYHCANDRIFTDCKNKEKWSKFYAEYKNANPDATMVFVEKCELNKETCGFAYKPMENFSKEETLKLKIWAEIKSGGTEQQKQEQLINKNGRLRRKKTSKNQESMF